ncbi:septation protein A [Aureimonas glaciei]|jgi:intracellular septation protein|uniref:Inner membrane-spanning protein YciB n=1 Tax=Aureimonas glaciei TaxID=1776957 RepID=A0A916YES2_9HYPH|nr:septation protein A [Aureimonas glaciei]GGD41961.1 putative intracellular septation protein A [Aureimonas glaciei]
MAEHHLIEGGPNAPEENKINPMLKFALELGPLVVFFFANSRGPWLAERFPALAELGGPLFIATGLFMVATVVALSVSWALTRTLPVMPLVSGFFVIVFGTLTIWLQNETFIKMKPTIVNALFGAILLGGLLFGRSLLGYVFNQAFKLDDAGWRKLTMRWGLFFLVMAAVNEIVWRNFSTDFWAGFKVWATMPITMVFMLCQIPLLQRHATESLFGDTEPKK